MRYLKNIGLAALVVGAFAALVGVASASAAEFHATTKGVALSGEATTPHNFYITGSTITCEVVKFTGTTEATASTTQKVHPEYSGCTAFGFANATINTFGCQYNLHTQSGTLDIEGCLNGAIVVEANNVFGKCVVKYPDQFNVASQSWTTGGTSPNRDIRWTANVTNLRATVTTSTGICPVKVGEHPISSYTGTTTIKSASGEVWYA